MHDNQSPLSPRTALFSSHQSHITAYMKVNVAGGVEVVMRKSGSATCLNIELDALERVH
jgi:hypothetical protein